MAYVPTGTLIQQPLSDVSAVQVHDLGTTVVAVDPANSFPEGEFVYVKGVANVVKGSVCVIDSDGALVLSGARTKGRLGVAMGAIDSAAKFGWVQTKGRAVAKAQASANKAPAYFHANAGEVSNVAVAGDLVISARFAGALNDPGAGLAYLDIDHPRGADFDNA